MPSPLSAPPGTTPRQQPAEGGRQPRAGAGQQQQPDNPTAWNPSGYWPDPYQPRFNTEFRPHEFIGALVNSKPAQDYENPEQTQEAIGTQSIRAGEKNQIDESNQEAANQGLGRGYADQEATDIRQKGSEQVAEQTMGAHLEGASRRFQVATLMAQSLLEANKARFTAYLNSKAQSSAQSSSILGAIGQILGGGLPLLGAL